MFMEEKLIKVLLAQYKEQGIDMYALLDDTFFKGMPLPRKVEFIKQHAKEISEGTGRGLSRRDLGALAFDGGLSGIMTGVTAGLAAREAGKHFRTGMTPWGLVAGAVALGAGMAAGSSYLNGHKRLQQRAEILRKIDDTINNPSDENALTVLVTRNNQLNPIARVALQSTSAAHMANVMKNVPKTLLKEVDPYMKFKGYEYNNNNNHSGYRDGEDTASFLGAFDHSAASMTESMNKSLEDMKKSILGK